MSGPIITDIKPPSWGGDPLSKFLDDCRQNALATFNNLKAQWDLLIRIDAVYGTATSNLHQVSSVIEPLLLPRAHASYRAAVHVASTAQLPEAYMVLRGCLEFALYANFMSGNLARQERWLRRQESPDAKKAVKDEFKVRAMFDALRGRDAHVGRMVGELYDNVIDLGAHPNELVVSSVMGVKKDDEGKTFEAEYFSPGGMPHRLCLKRTAQVGIASLRTFALLLPQRFDILGIPEQLDQLSVGL